MGRQQSLMRLGASAVALHRRIWRFWWTLVVLYHVRRIVDGTYAHWRHLVVQYGRSAAWTVLWKAFKYSTAAQLVRLSEYLLCLVKPILAARIARLLVYKGSHVRTNLAYGKHHRQRLDLYGVAHEQGERGRALKPVLLFVHGGAWAFGHKWQYGLVGDSLFRSGVVVGVMNYRAFPEGTVPDMVEDVQQAVRWVVENVAKYGGDPKRIHVAGHSAGAHLCALALVQEALNAHAAQEQLQAESDALNDTGAPLKTSSSESVVYIHRHVRSFIGLSGPYDIEDHYYFESQRVIGPLKGVHEISPMKPVMLGEGHFHSHSPTRLLELFLSKSERMELPKCFILHGREDTTVPTSSSVKLVERLKQAHVHAEYHELSRCTHEDVVFALMGENSSVQDQLLNHLHRILYHDEHSDSM